MDWRVVEKCVELLKEKLRVRSGYMKERSVILDLMMTTSRSKFERSMDVINVALKNYSALQTLLIHIISSVGV
jgi:hypothetical protein